MLYWGLWNYVEPIDIRFFSQLVTFKLRYVLWPTKIIKKYLNIISYFPVLPLGKRKSGFVMISSKIFSIVIHAYLSICLEWLSYPIFVGQNVVERCECCAVRQIVRCKCYVTAPPSFILYYELTKILINQFTFCIKNLRNKEITYRILFVNIFNKFHIITLIIDSSCIYLEYYQTGKINLALQVKEYCI